MIWKNLGFYALIALGALLGIVAGNVLLAWHLVGASLGALLGTLGALWMAWVLWGRDLGTVDSERAQRGLRLIGELAARRDEEAGHAVGETIQLWKEGGEK